MPAGFKRFSAYAAAGLSGLIALALLNVAADKTGIKGLDALRNLITRTN